MDSMKKAYETMTGRKGNCAQSVFAAFSSDLGLDEKTAYNITQAFGGGMHVNSVCGAVTGAYMTLGLANPITPENARRNYEKIETLRNEFNRRFKEIYGSINCTDLLGYDITKPEEAAKARESDIFTAKCPNFVRDAAKILEDLLELPEK